MQKKQTKIWLNILLDESPSMCDCQAETIKEFNSFIEDQQKTKDIQILATLTTFSTSAKHVYIARPIEEVPKLCDENYDPSSTSGTALYDAIGASMGTVDESMRREDENTGVLFVIITDGEENSSRKLDLETVCKMIADKKEKDWTFVFIGADIDAWQGQNLGIRSSVATKKANTANMYRAVSKGATLYSAARSRGETVESFMELNPEDYQGLNE